MVASDLSNHETARFEALLLDSVGEAVIATDAGGTVIYWNTAAERLYGWTAQEAVGQSVVELTPAPQSMEEAAAIFAELAAGRSWSGEFVVRHRDGTPFPIHVTDTPVFGADGTMQAIIGISTDITERRRAERTVRHLSAIVESSNDAIMSMTLEGTILSWNQGAVNLSGFAPHEVIGQNIEIMAGDEANREEMADLLRRVALGETVERLETVRRRKDGSLVDVSLSISPVREEDGAIGGFSTIARDDTARKEEERALKHQSDLLISRLSKEAAAADRLRELDRMKDELVANVSHELRTPLASILGYVELLMDEEANPLTPQQRNWADAVDRNGARLLAVVDDLLTASTIEAAKLQLNSAPVDLRDVISCALQGMESWIEGRRLTTHFNLPATPIIVQGDAGQLEQVVWNLVSNAVKFTDDGGTVECTLDIEDSQARLTVSDNGIGIPQNEQSQLFTRFFRSTTATNRAIPGTGLGLSITFAIVKGHGGDISVVSTPGRGTRMTVDLPMAAPTQS